MVPDACRVSGTIFGMTVGTVYLIGAGPGDPKLITVGGADALKSAEVVVYDRLAHPKLLDYAPPSAERVYVGKQADKHAMRQERHQCLAGWTGHWQARLWLGSKAATRLCSGAAVRKLSTCASENVPIYCGAGRDFGDCRAGLCRHSGDPSRRGFIVCRDYRP